MVAVVVVVVVIIFVAVIVAVVVVVVAVFVFVASSVWSLLCDVVQTPLQRNQLLKIFIRTEEMNSNLFVTPLAGRKMSFNNDNCRVEKKNRE